jgi:hypothetical protein
VVPSIIVGSVILKAGGTTLGTRKREGGRVDRNSRIKPRHSACGHGWNSDGRCNDADLKDACSSGAARHCFRYFWIETNGDCGSQQGEAKGGLGRERERWEDIGTRWDACYCLARGWLAPNVRINDYDS